MKNKQKIRLGVNLDHVATLRAVRAHTTDYPSLFHACQIVLDSGASHITLHLREDQRHVQETDIAQLTGFFPINLEMAPTDRMLKIAKKYKPQSVCLVPEKRQELTTEGGLDVLSHKRSIGLMINELTRLGIHVSLFINADSKQVKAAHEVQAQAVEFHTGHWMTKTKGKTEGRSWHQLIKAASLAHHLKLVVHAGHGLDYQGTHSILQLPYLQEVNIGHFIVCQSIVFGLKLTLKQLQAILSFSANKGEILRWQKETYESALSPRHAKSR